MLRGEYGRARATLLAARAKDPKSPFIANNLRLLEQSARKHKAVN
jgi:Flp pilus assembly protein TadD